MLKTLYLKNFKSIQEAPIDFSDFNIVVGLNGAGKTNLIQSIGFIKALVMGEDVSIAARKIATSPHELFNRNSASKEIEISVTFSDLEENEYCLNFMIGFSQAKNTPTKLQILSEKLEKIDSTGIRKTIYIRTGIKIENADNKAIPLNVEEEHLAISSYVNIDAKNAKNSFSNIFMPNERTIDSRESVVLENTSGLAGLLTKLKNHKPDEYKKFQTIVSKLIPSFASVADPESISEQQISSDPEENKYYLVLIEEKNLNGKLSMKSISTGDIRTSYIIACTLAVKEGSTVVIEELENGIHPKRAKDLIQYVDKISKVRNLQIIFTTHSSAIINTVRAGDIIFVEKAGETGTRVTSFRNIEQQNRIKEILEEGGELTDYLSYKTKL